MFARQNATWAHMPIGLSLLHWFFAKRIQAGEQPRADKIPMANPTPILSGANRDSSNREEAMLPGITKCFNGLVFTQISNVRSMNNDSSVVCNDVGVSNMTEYVDSVGIFFGQLGGTTNK